MENETKELLKISTHAFKIISRIGDNLSHIGCEGRIYTLSDDQFGDIMYMRDVSDLAIREINLFVREKKINDRMNDIEKVKRETLVKLSRTVILDFFSYIHRLGLTNENITIANVEEYCRAWIRENVREKIDEKHIDD